jgi:hypothetical protein
MAACGHSTCSCPGRCARDLCAAESSSVDAFHANGISMRSRLHMFSCHHVRMWHVLAHSKQPTVACSAEIRQHKAHAQPRSRSRHGLVVLYSNSSARRSRFTNSATCVPAEPNKGQPVCLSLTRSLPVSLSLSLSHSLSHSLSVHMTEEAFNQVHHT